MMRKARTADFGYRSDRTQFFPTEPGDLLLVRLVSRSPGFPFTEIRAALQIDFPHNHRETAPGRAIRNWPSLKSTLKVQPGILRLELRVAISGSY